MLFFNYCLATRAHVVLGFFILNFEHMGAFFLLQIKKQTKADRDRLLNADERMCVAERQLTNFTYRVFFHSTNIIAVT